MNRSERLRRWGPMGFLALIAYLPALTAAPGRMPSDSKLYLYLDPGGFLGDAAGSFDPGQFAGWVPHQHVSYLWPAGPWFWLFEAIGLPDWVAHRLWLGSLLLAAGLGVRWCARLLGLGPAPALVAATVYQTSLYVLPYVSRTSVMLLPWAGLGWIVGCTVRATARRSWADPAAIALLVLTVGGVNATALAMIVPGPVLWIVHELWRRSIGWRDAAVVAGRTAVLSAGVSLWWLAALTIQGRYGADVLPYSESLADVSLTATSTEVWRSLGYWLFYVRDPYAATTTESLRYLSSTPAIVVSYLVPVVCLAGLVWVRWAHRRFAALLVVAGGVLAVGVHPIDDRNPLMRVVAGGDDGLALALRSSTRALPLLMLGLALAGGSLVAAMPSRRLRSVSLRHGTTALVGLLALANLPGLWTGAIVDPALERDQDPPQAWLDAAGELDAAGADGRVLMLPGIEFGAYRWGYTVDQPLPGLTDAPLVTRDLLPLGSPAAMDLLYAFDDRFQDGVAEPAALGPVARLFAADTVWLTNDLAFDRFRTARPEVVRSVVLMSEAVTDVLPFGAPGVNLPDVSMSDERSLGDPRVGQPAVPVELAELAGDAPLARAYDHTLLVAGSGDGLVDAAAAGLLADDVGVRYAADDPALADTDLGQLVTDSHRDRARHWRSSQDTTGYTEAGGPRDGVLSEVAGDARLPVFATDDPARQTIALQRGPVTARATSYGEPFAYLPEHRPSSAIDGDPATAWLVGEHADPVGETIRLAIDRNGAAPTGLRLLQSTAAGDRRITGVRVVEYDSSEAVLADRAVVLDDTSTASGQDVGLGVPDARRIDRIDITITAVGGGTPFTASAVAAVGFGEIDLGLGPTEEVVRPPTPVLDASDDRPIGYLFTRLRVDPMDRWRDDPEPRLVREITLSAARTFAPEYWVRVDARATDAELAGLLGWPIVASTRLTGSLRTAGVAAFDGDPATTWTTAFDGALGATLRIDRITEPVDRISLTQPVPGISVVTEIEVRSGNERRRVPLDRDVLGTASATLDPPLPPGEVEIELVGVDVATTVDRRFGDVIELPAAIGEIGLAGAPLLAPLGSGRMTLRCAEIGSVAGVPLVADVTIAGDAWLDGAALTTEPCDPVVDLGAGSHVLRGAGGVLDLDRVLLDDGLRDALAADRDGSAVTVRDRDRFGGTYEVRGCADGCWFVFGEGRNDGWAATAADADLGPPHLLDGGFNGWWLQPGTTDVTVRWTPQRTQDVAFLLSVLAVLLCLALLVWERRGTAGGGRPVERAPSPTLSWECRPIPWPAWAVVAAWALPALLLAGPIWAAFGLAGGIVASRFRGVPLAALTTLVTVGTIGLAVTYLERRDTPAPGGGWPTTFESLHWLGMFALATLCSSALTDDVPPAEPADRYAPDS